MNGVSPYVEPGMITQSGTAALVPGRNGQRRLILMLQAGAGTHGPALFDSH